MLAVLFTILFQSIHTTEHLWEEYLQDDTTVVVHHNDQLQYLNFKGKHHQCMICAFTLSPMITPDHFYIQTTTLFKAIHYCFKTNESAVFFSGSLFSHRGPPISIC